VADIAQTDFSGLTFDVVMSDMAPSTTGIKSVDQAKSFELCELAFNTAVQHLKMRGHFICKIFHGEDFDRFRKSLREVFTKVEVIKPESTRKASKEIFLVGLSRYRP
jgi:23S rRNA (uridine2552-2'-O)-methyltransferase